MHADLCIENKSCNFWQSSYQASEDYPSSQFFNCHLLSSCQPRYVDSAASVEIYSGVYGCLAEIFSQRKRIQISLAARVIYLIFSALVYSVHTTHYTPEAEEEQTEQSFPSYYIFTKHKSIVQWS